MCKTVFYLVTVLLVCGLGQGALRADVTLLSDIPGAEVPYISGDETEANKAFSPASTFKMIIALTAFEQKIATPETELTCTDPYLSPKPQVLKFQKAMQDSSNDFFRQLVDKLTDAQLLDMAKRCGFGEVTGEAPKDRKDWTHGGVIRVTPMQEHQFLRKLIRGKLPVAVECQKQLMAVMVWPAVQAGVNVYGKTGSYEKTYWFSGIAVKAGGAVRVITVTLTAEDANRARAIQRFYDQVPRVLPVPAANSQ